MKAVICTRYGPPEVLELREVAEPSPGRGEVRVRIAATAVTASDVMVRSFSVSPAYRILMGLALGIGKPRNPILGMVLSGTVETAGAGVGRFKPGDPVYALSIARFGAYAEAMCVDENTAIALKPSNMTFEQAAAIPYGGLLALHFLKKGRIAAGQDVLIYGASGAIGTAAIQLARHFGARVTAVCSAGNIGLVESLGAEAVIDYTREDFTARAGRYDLILNAVGKRKARLRPERLLKPDGRHVTVDDGSPRIGCEALELLTRLAEAGKLRAVIDCVFPLEQIAEAHRYVDQGHKKGNVIVSVGRAGG